MPAKVAGISVEFGANVARMQKDLGKMSKDIHQWSQKNKKSFAQTWQGMATGINQVIGIAGTAVRHLEKIGRAVGKIVDAGADFEEATVDMAKVTNRDLGLIRKEILALPPVLGSSTKLMRGYYQTISAGVTDPIKAIQLLTVASKAGNAAHLEQEQVIKALTKMMAGFEGQIKDATTASDLLFAIEKEGQTTFAELVPVIGDVSKISSELNISYKEMAAALALITQTAGSTAEATTQFKGVAMGMLKANETMTEGIEKLGFKSAKAMIAEIGLGESLRRLKEYAKETDIPLAKLFRSAEGLLGLSAMSAKNFDTYNQKVDYMGKISGETQKAFERWEKTWKGLKATFINTIGKIVIQIGTDLIPVLGQYLKQLTVWIEKNQELITQNVHIVIDKIAKSIDKVVTAAEKIYEIYAKYETLPKWVKTLMMGGMIGPKVSTKLTEQLSIALGLLKELEEWDISIGYRKPPKIEAPELAKAPKVLSETWKKATESMEEYIKTAQRLAAIEYAPPFDWEEWIEKGKDLKEIITEYETILLPKKRTTDFWVGMVEGIQYFGKNAKEIMATVFSADWQQNFWVGMWEKAKEFASKIPSMMKKAFDFAIAGAKWLITLPTRITDAMWEFNRAITNFPAIIAEFREVAKQFIANLPQMIDSLVAAADEFITGIIDKLPEIINALLAQVPKLVTVLTEKLIPAFIRKIPEIIRSFIRNIPPIINAFIRGIPEIIAAMAKAIPQVILVLIQEAPRIANALITGLIEGIPRIITEFVSSIPQIVSELISALWKQIPIIGGEGAGILGGIPIVGPIIEGAGNIIEDIPIIGDIFGGLFHKGGIVGTGTGLMRPMPAMAFAGVPRAHFGLGPDERPVITKKDEGIFTPEQMRALGQPRDSVIQNHITINLDGRKLGTWIYDGTRSGSIQIHERSITRR